ncbi:MAG: PhoH family protein [Phycisphaerae bacterium]
MELVITLNPVEQRVALYGPHDRHLRRIRDSFGVKLFARDHDLKLSGEPDAVTNAATVIEKLQQLLREHGHVREEDVDEQIAALTRPPVADGSGELEVFRRDVRVIARSEGQRVYVDAVMHHDLTFCVGPAGTGKTYLAVALALALLKRGKLKKIVLARPAVEAGEKLGYLPGDLQAKVNPFLRPLFDAMNDMMDFDQVRKLIANDVIEVCPLAFMRGRTLTHAAIILDEAQNASVAQMFMFLTRMGEHGKMIVAGDDSQIDLPRHEQSGLVDALMRFREVPGIATVRLGKPDIVRHPLVARIVDAYAGGSGSA